MRKKCKSKILSKFPTFLWLEAKTIKRRPASKFLVGDVLTWSWEPTFEIERFTRYKLDTTKRRKKRK